MDGHGIRQELTSEAASPGADRTAERPPRTAEDPIARAVAVQRLDMKLSRCCSIDLEVSPSTDEIHALAGVRYDTEATYHTSQARPKLRTHLLALDTLAEGADFLMGHNLIKFDLPYLRAAQPGLCLLELPVIDTLWLNPLAFPRFPYHHLVKHYRQGDLKRHTRNDPELDARLALKAFQNQQEALLDAEPSLLAAWHWLCTGPDEPGFNLFFAALRRSPRPSEAEGRNAIGERLEGVACVTQACRVIGSDTGHGWSLAYALAWLSVCGGNSVMPPWVRHQFPEAGKLVRLLRDTACAAPACRWCRQRHDARGELKRFFDFDGYRPEPSDEHGHPLQQAIVEAAMAGEHVLGILPTSTGKSICYQVPALSRYDKTGALTVVISPLTALMADQVAGLEAKGITSCVSISGMLSMPERADALERLRLGDAAIVLCSPEQLRSVSLRRALDQREIGAWVLDEAHCLSKWGHDFRPDYRYVGRFIREKAQDGATPPVLCLTATAKPDVKSEIVDYFREQLGVEMRVLDGGSERTNLEFEVVPTSEATKLHDIHLILEQHLSSETEGGAIVYCATRRHTEVVAGFLAEKGLSADRFHAGLQPEEKKNVQRRFIDGELQVIAATNAFGMGIDKPDVRLVVHADIPSSLENYLQEAGRAGRDQQNAHCVLLYTKDDIDRQFTMSARSRLTRREIHSVLRALRRLRRRNKDGGDEFAASVGEILAEDEEHEFRRDSATDDTRARTAVMWLEDAQLLSRDENKVRVFASSLRVQSVAEARQRLSSVRMTDSELRSLIKIVEALIESDPDAGISTDHLMSVTGLDSPGVRRALWRLEQLGVASDDTAITAFVHHGVLNSSRKRLDQASAVERDLLDWMREQVPELDVGEKAPLDLRVASQRLREEGHKGTQPGHVTRILRGVARDGHVEGGGSGSLTLRTLHAESVAVTLLEPLRSLCELEGIRSQMAKDDTLSVWQLRETQALVGWLRERQSALMRNSEVHDWLHRQAKGRWIDLLEQAVQEHEQEAGDAETPVDSFVEWLAEWTRDARRRQRDLLLTSAHKAKGLEFDHVVVLDGGWERSGRDEDPDASRRLYYVAMTRARQTLALGRLAGSQPFHDALRDRPTVLWREPLNFPPPAPELTRRYRGLTLRDVYLSFAGRKPARDRVHPAIAALSPGDPLQVRVRSRRWELLNDAGIVVGTLARGFEPLADTRCVDAAVTAVISWNRERSDPQYQDLQCDEWEVVVPELVFEPL